MVDGLDSSNLHSAPVAVTTSESVVFPPKPNDEFKFMLDLHLYILQLKTMLI